jgi:hypothetical protein
MHGPINVKSPNNISKWQMGFNPPFKGLISFHNIKSVAELKQLGLSYFTVFKHCNIKKGRTDISVSHR